MSKERMRRGDHSQPDHECKEVAELLDAYATDELVGDEKNTVEKHLASCRACQLQLMELQHFRKLLASLMVNDQHPRIDGAMVPILSNQPSSRLANAVMNEIVKNEGATMKQTHLATPPQERPSTSLPPPRRMKRKIWSRPMGLLVAALCATIVAATLLVVVNSLRQSPRSGTVSVIQPLIWKVRSGQVSVQNAEGTFALVGPH
jgi:anti-sigma factor RsiW